MSREREARELADGIRRQVRGLVKRAGEGDTEALVELQGLEGLIPDALVYAAKWARELRTADGTPWYTWQTIGGELGMTRQAAHKRFGLAELPDIGFKPGQGIESAAMSTENAS